MGYDTMPAIAVAIGYLAIAAYVWRRNYLWWLRPPIIGPRWSLLQIAFIMGLLWPLSIIPAAVFGGGFKWWGNHGE